MCNNIKNGPSLPSESYGLRQGLAAISVSCCGTLKWCPLSFSMKLTFRILTISRSLIELSLLLGIEGIVSGEGVLLCGNLGSGIGSCGGVSLVLTIDSELLSGCITEKGALFAISLLIFSAGMLFRMLVNSFNLIK